MKKWIEHCWRVIVEALIGIRYIVRWPTRDRDSRVNVGMWFFALLLACWSIGMHVHDQNWGSFFLWMNVALLFLDAYMLTLAIRGVRYRRRIRRARHA